MFELYNSTGRKTGLYWYHPEEKIPTKFIAEAGIKLVPLKYVNIFCTYRLLGFKDSSFTIDGGFIMPKKKT